MSTPATCAPARPRIQAKLELRKPLWVQISHLHLKELNAELRDKGKKQLVPLYSYLEFPASGQHNHDLLMHELHVDQFEETSLRAKYSYGGEISYRVKYSCAPLPALQPGLQHFQIWQG